MSRSPKSDDRRHRADPARANLDIESLQIAATRLWYELAALELQRSRAAHRASLYAALVRDLAATATFAPTATEPCGEAAELLDGAATCLERCSVQIARAAANTQRALDRMHCFGGARYGSALHAL